MTHLPLNLLSSGERLKEVDPELFNSLRNELNRQRNTIELIASENFASIEVLQVQGSVLTNKYAEGYPGNRYYGGCFYVDQAEDLAIERAKALFNADHANVQPHSGAQANMAVYFAALEIGDRVLALSLSNGGHLTHGLKVNFSGRWYEFSNYGLSEKTHLIDYDQVYELALKYRPKMIVTGASAYPRDIDYVRFREIADEIGAYLMVDMAHLAGMIAAGLLSNPVPYSDFVTSTTHKTLRGPRGGLILCRERFAKEIDSAVFPGIQGGPLMHVIAAKALAFKEAETPQFKKYQEMVIKNAAALAGSLQKEGFDLVTGGTDTHMVLVDLSNFDIDGRQAEELLDRVGITVNKNAVPYDKKPPQVTSGMRLGTPAMTTRGVEEQGIAWIGELIGRVIKNRDDEELLKQTRREVVEFLASYPLYPELDMTKE